MGETANYQLPYPERTDKPQGADQMKALAEATDDALTQERLVVADTSTVDLVGTGTAADPLKANVLSSGLPVPAFPLYDECGSLTEWVRAGGTGTWALSIANVADSVMGGNVIRAVGNVAPLVRVPLVPFDPNVLYRVKFRVRQTVDPTVGGKAIYAGIEAIAADGVSLVTRAGAIGTTRDNPHQAANGVSLTIAQNWQEFVGYVKGTTGTTAPTGPFPDPSASGPIHQNARYIRPYIYANHAGGDGTAEIDYVSLEIVPSDVVTADSTEIDFSGGTGGTPLSAALTGTRTGNWVMPTGDLTLNTDGDTAARHVVIKRFVNPNQYEFRFRSGGASLVIQTYTNTVIDASLAFFNTGTLSVDVGGVVRPIPFATATGRVPCTAPAAGTGVSVAVTFPTNRFTVVPLVTVGGESNGYSAASMSAVTLTGVTVRYYNPTAVSHTNTFISWHAIQMLSTGNEPLTAPPVVGVLGTSHVLVCHTDGCPNEDVPISLTYEDDVSYVCCGPCAQPITDVVTP